MENDILEQNLPESSYNESDIQVLEGLEAVRKRPGMYIGSTGPRGLHHLVYEIVDNSIDEALAGYCDHIEVDILPGDIIQVKDNGRGIPVGINEKLGLPAVTVVLTVLHAGGKFGGGGYKVAGGLHGVGSSVVNALSQWLEVEVSREGHIHHQRFEQGKAVTDLKIIGDTEKTGTVVRFKADPEIFTETTEYDFETLQKRLREQAFLNAGLTITFSDRRDEENIKTETHCYEGGISSFVEYLNKTRGYVALHDEVIHLVIGTDPDCDRVGVGVRHNGNYVLLTGNQTGALLVDFVLKFRKDSMPANAAVVKTIVTSGLGAAIAEKYGAKSVQTLTGFKYIGEKICLWEESGENTFVFGYEESYGYLAGTHARDKDAVSASMLIAEMAAYHKNNGRTLVDALDEIYAEYGYYFDCLETYVLKGKEGAEKIQSAMKAMRESGESLFDDLDVLLDYSKGIDGLPKENVLRFDFKDGSWAAARPSGTEPKLKLYFSVKGENCESAEKRKNDIQAVLSQKIYG